MKKKELQSIDYIKERADENLAKTKREYLLLLTKINFKEPFIGSFFV